MPEPKNAEDAKALDDKIDRALREGALLAGRLGGNTPRAIKDLLEPKTRWQDELREFVNSTTRGKDEYTWRKFNRRLLPNDIYMPTVENETVGELVVAIDTSGSIGDTQISEFATELVSICETATPERIRVLWWDTCVHAEQIYEPDMYDSLRYTLKPVGGGGTRVGCVPEYINKKNLKPECVIVFTDGFVESSPKWDITSPTLWLVTANKNWTPPAGRKVVFEK
jgi:predicted metal-dependent peptidase